MFGLNIMFFGSCFLVLFYMIFKKKKKKNKFVYMFFKLKSKHIMYPAISTRSPNLRARICSAPNSSASLSRRRAQRSSTRDPHRRSYPSVLEPSSRWKLFSPSHQAAAAPLGELPSDGVVWKGHGKEDKVSAVGQRWTAPHRSRSQGHGGPRTRRVPY